MIFDKFPYTNFHELNLHYFLVHFKEIFEQWHTLYNTMLEWKEATTEELAAWREEVESEIAEWETNLLAALDEWKDQTADDISDWETATLEALDAWKTAFKTLFNTTFSNLSEIKEAAEDARDAAIEASETAVAAADSISASAAQIETNRVRANHSWSLYAGDYTAIPNGTDFNDLTTVGNYKVISSDNMRTMTNSPVTTAALVVVEHGATTSVILQHVYASDGTGTVWYRAKLPSEWLTWRKIAPTDTSLTTQNAPADAKATGDKALYAIYTNYSNTTAISSNTDLNELTAVGNYRISSDAIAASLSHCPSAKSGRLLVIQVSTTSVIHQIYLANEDTPAYYYRTKTSSGWKTWARNADWNNIITPENVSITSENHATYFPNGKLADAPGNTMYYITDTRFFSDAPIGNNRIVTSLDDAGYMAGLLITLSAYRNKKGVVNSYSQMFISYRSNNYPVFAYRSGVLSNGVYVYGEWSKFEQNGYLHAANQVIYGGSLDVAPFTDLNDAPMNSIYQLDLNLDGRDAAHTLAHHPEPGVSSVVMTYAYSYSVRHGMVQTLFNLRGRMYWRYGYQQSQSEYRWTAWRLVNPDVPPIPAAPAIDGTYLLKATVSSGAATYAWEAQV